MNIIIKYKPMLLLLLVKFLWAQDYNVLSSQVTSGQVIVVVQPLQMSVANVMVLELVQQ